MKYRVEAYWGHVVDEFDSDNMEDVSRVIGGWLEQGYTVAFTTNGRQRVFAEISEVPSMGGSPRLERPEHWAAIPGTQDKH